RAEDGRLPGSGENVAAEGGDVVGHAGGRNPGRMRGVAAIEIGEAERGQIVAGALEGALDRDRRARRRGDGGRSLKEFGLPRREHGERVAAGTGAQLLLLDLGFELDTQVKVPAGRKRR